LKKTRRPGRHPYGIGSSGVWVDAVAMVVYNAVYTTIGNRRPRGRHRGLARLPLVDNVVVGRHDEIPNAMLPAIESNDEVHRVYGSVMHVVQFWELALALAWCQATTPAGERAEAESTASKKAVHRLETAFGKVTASQARKELGDDLPPEVLGSVSELVRDRNRLAHRFLRERQCADGFKPGTLAWLGDAGFRFDASVRALSVHMDSAGPYQGDVAPHWPAIGTSLTAHLFAGEPVDFEEILRKASETLDAD
jgi:hypothetical protein